MFGECLPGESSQTQGEGSFIDVCLVFDSGEQDAAPLLPYYLQVSIQLRYSHSVFPSVSQEYHGQSAVMRLAERYKGLAILWEHRFYGASLPFPVNVSKLVITSMTAKLIYTLPIYRG